MSEKYLQPVDLESNSLGIKKNKNLKVIASLILIGISGTCFYFLYQSFLWDFPQDVYDSRIEACSRWGGDWLIYSQNFDGSFKYEYYLDRNTYSTSYNYLRHWGTAYSLIYLYGQSQANEYRDGAKKAFDWGLKYFKTFPEDPDIGYLQYHDVANMGGSALALMGMIYYHLYCDDDRYDEYIEKLGNFLVWAQNPNGWIRSYYCKDGSYDINENSSFYQSETMLAYALLLKMTGEAKYSIALERAYAFYSDLSKFNWHDSPFTPWATSAFCEFFFLTENASYAQFAFDMCDWKIPAYQILTNSADELGNDEMGGFGTPPGISTSSTIEMLADAYQAAKILNDTTRMASYNHSIVLAAEFVLSMQMREEQCNDLKLSNRQAHRAFGGFRGSHITNTSMIMRIDYAQHTITGLVKIWKYFTSEQINSINMRKTYF